MVRPADVVTNVERRFTSELHETRNAALLGIALGVSFGTCFLTGLLSHLIQHPRAGSSGRAGRPACTASRRACT